MNNASLMQENAILSKKEKDNVNVDNYKKMSTTTLKVQPLRTPHPFRHLILQR
jgi:hypothetical protein